MSSDFTIVSWNIFQGLHYTTARSNWTINAPIEEHVAALDADVLVLPETWRINRPDATWAEDMAAHMGYELHQWVSDSPSRARERSQWRMVIMTRIPVRRLDDHVFPVLGPFGQRAAVRVELLESGLVIAGMHLLGIHLLARAAIRDWRRERAELAAVAGEADIVAGDMNMWSPVVHRDTANLRPTVKARTFPANRPHSQIDHLLVSDRVEVISAAALPELGSDHLGLRATLRKR